MTAMAGPCAVVFTQNLLYYASAWMIKKNAEAARGGLRVKLRLFGAALTAIFSFQAAASGDPVKPPVPVLNVPDLRTNKIQIVCVECDAPFDTVTHKGLLEDLAANLYVGELRKALYIQDSVHQFHSKVHFDNCDFDSAIGYIDSLYAEVGAQVAVAEAAKTIGDKTGAEAAVLKAFFALGQALHGAQDFLRAFKLRRA